jgi:hypothetical protein
MIENLMERLYHDCPELGFMVVVGPRANPEGIA